MNCKFCNQQCINNNNVCSKCSTSGQEYNNMSKQIEKLKKHFIGLGQPDSYNYEEIGDKLNELIDAYNEMNKETPKQNWEKEFDKMLEEHHISISSDFMKQDDKKIIFNYIRQKDKEEIVNKLVDILRFYPTKTLGKRGGRMLVKSLRIGLKIYLISIKIYLKR